MKLWTLHPARWFQTTLHPDALFSLISLTFHLIAMETVSVAVRKMGSFVLLHFNDISEPGGLVNPTGTKLWRDVCRRCRCQWLICVSSTPSVQISSILFLLQHLTPPSRLWCCAYAAQHSNFHDKKRPEFILPQNWKMTLTASGDSIHDNQRSYCQHRWSEIRSMKVMRWHSTLHTTLCCHRDQYLCVQSLWEM